MLGLMGSNVNIWYTLWEISWDWMGIHGDLMEYPPFLSIFPSSPTISPSFSKHFLNFVRFHAATQSGVAMMVFRRSIRAAVACASWNQ